MFSSLKTKLLFLVSALLFLAITIVGSFIYIDNLKGIETGLGERALGIARTAATAINGNHHHKVSQNIGAAADMEELKTIRQKLREIKTTNNLQTDVYTYIKAWWVKDQDSIVFLASSNTDPFTIKGQPMEPYMKIALEKAESGYSDIFTTINGEWITGYAPIKTEDGTVTGVVEIALETSKEVAQAKIAFIKGVALAAGIALLIGLFLTFFVAGGIAKPIISLNGVTKQMAEGDFKARAVVEGKDEVAKLGTDFNVMAENLEKSYKELENYSKNLEKMVDERTAEVVAGKKKIQKILNHIEQGILTFDSTLTVDSEFSAFLAKFYHTDPASVAGRSVMDFIFPESNLSADEYNLTSETLNSVVGENSIAWDFNSDHLPSESTIRVNSEEKIIALEWTPIVNEEDITERLMLAMRDLTTQRQLEAQMAAQKAADEKMMTIIAEMVAHKRNSLTKYFNDADMRVDRAVSQLKGEFDATAIFRDLHTVKGGARLLKAKSLMNAAHLAEEPCQKILKGEKTEKQTLVDNVGLLQKEMKEYLHVLNDVLGGGGNGDSTQVGDNETLPGIIGPQVSTLIRNILDNGLTLNSVRCNDQVVAWKKKVISEIGNMIMHGLNNSIDHGYLLPKERGKALYQVDLEIDAFRNNETVTIEIKDLGEGFNLDKIKRAAKERGIAIGNDENSVLDSLFADGVSTAEAVSESSGRGVGLSAVKDMAGNLGGSVKMRRNEPKGAKLVIELPSSAVIEPSPPGKTIHAIAS